MPGEPEINTKRASNVDAERVRSLVFSVLDEFGLKPEPGGTDRDLDDIEGNYGARGGFLELIEDGNGELLGTAGLYPIDEKTVELRKMYFHPRIRGLGYGNKTLQRLIDAAKERGFERIYLETASVLKGAVHLYEKFGFEPTDEKHSARCDQAYILELGGR